MKIALVVGIVVSSVLAFYVIKFFFFVVKFMFKHTK